MISGFEANEVSLSDGVLCKMTVVMLISPLRELTCWTSRRGVAAVVTLSSFLSYLWIAPQWQKGQDNLYLRPVPGASLLDQAHFY